MSNDKLKNIDRFSVLEEIGRGGMGCVYKGYDQKLHRTIAIKTILPERAKEIHRFKREAKAIAALSHPNIVKIHNIELKQSQPYFTMDFIEGISLKKYIKQTPLDVRKFTILMIKITNAVVYAHSQNVIHRDLKPENILISKESHYIHFFIAIGYFIIKTAKKNAAFEEKEYQKYKGCELEINNKSLKCANMILDPHTRKILVKEGLGLLVLPWQEIDRFDITYNPSSEGEAYHYKIRIKSGQEMYIFRKHFLNKENEILPALNKTLTCPLCVYDKELLEKF